MANIEIARIYSSLAYLRRKKDALKVEYRAWKTLKIHVPRLGRDPKIWKLLRLKSGGMKRLRYKLYMFFFSVDEH